MAVSSKQEIPEPFLERVADRLKALGNPTRLRIVHTLHDGELAVAKILARVGTSQANVSKHLNVLRMAGLVTSRREGSSVFYRIADPSVFKVCDAMCDAMFEHASEQIGSISAGRNAMRAAR